MPASKITRDTAAVLLALDAGRTLTIAQLGEQIETQYAYANRRTTFGSHDQVHRLLAAAGVTSRLDQIGTGGVLYDFPAAIAAQGE
ncbi:hypothetical protein [Tsukamurella spumae]|uniref:Uncharacterized protein n=1 Tax=Tsukamurella spumae TaxID=44753 RepID=A0A846X4T2_9ACTN|nr:hypothetical protein [Tsukamurella spumae]NKY19536.1 hypothetical protein [Tsukamurella spumae]